MKAKVIDIVSTKTGEILGYYKKMNKWSEVWDLRFYPGNESGSSIHLDYVRTWKVLDYTRSVRSGRIDDVYLLYRFI